MILKVLKAMFTSNEAKLPDHWPVEANIPVTGEEISPPWLQMTLDELNALREAHKEEYHAWAERQKVAEEERKKAEEKEKKAEEKEKKAPLYRLKKKLEGMGFEDYAIEILMGCALEKTEEELERIIER
jgi:beta-phosphoglucomutase-like phosphatase (HAD superfamily)